MKTVSLTQGKVATVDNKDFKKLNKYKWYATKKDNNWYACRSIKPSIFMHRQILGLKYKDGVKSDHKNGNGLDNRRQNLRKCTNAQNIQNQKIRLNGTSKYKGVYKQNKRWRAVITYNRLPILLGYFNNEIDAAKAYDMKAKELFGEFARLNISS